MKVTHEFGPYYDKNSEILILGSIPSPKSREIGFYYGHPQNRFWKVLEQVYSEKIEDTIPCKKAFLTKHHLALWDVLSSCYIKGASDSTIKSPIVNDINQVILNSKVKKIYTTGKTAYNLYNKYCYKKTNIKAVYLPSTSPTNCRLKLQDLTEEYKILKN